uniref:Uncharacterized protein n=1 Tax=Siphoviridae sp. ctcUB23 TaxID=2825573 RepID=A0A8S5PKR7_9CAUD|nr:MAG TPA: hypothetical protein [Siphoviridae sp. ctcUB23]
MKSKTEGPVTSVAWLPSYRNKNGKPVQESFGNLNK